MDKDINKGQGKPWLQSGNEFRQMPSSAELASVLPKAVYTAKFDVARNEIYLEKIDDKFSFNGKIYGLEDKFIHHVLKTFEKTTQNMGILLNGAKGTGKTVCAKIIANEMNLPVILCDIPVQELTSFIAQFNIPAIFFFDEFEKNFANKTEILLSAMDGAYNTETRKIFLLTTNNLYINDNFLSRPSRIRYRKTFGNLSEEVIREYCEENLKDKSRYQEIANFIDTLSLSTIDILKSIVEEVNLHDCSVDEFKGFFNVTTAPYQYNVILVEATNLYSVEEFKKETELYLKQNGFQSADELENDNDDDSSNKRKKPRVDLAKPTKNRGYFTATKVSASVSATMLKEGDSFYHGTVIKSMDKDGVLVLDNNYNYGKPYIFVKILDIEAKPSLYSSVAHIF